MCWILDTGNIECGTGLLHHGDVCPFDYLGRSVTGCLEVANRFLAGAHFVIVSQVINFIPALAMDPIDILKFFFGGHGPVVCFSSLAQLRFINPTAETRPWHDMRRKLIISSSIPCRRSSCRSFCVHLSTDADLRFNCRHTATIVSSSTLNSAKRSHTSKPPPWKNDESVSMSAGPSNAVGSLQLLLFR